ncbi:MAG: hypothetical protein UY16_C0016G0016 [Candidatus Gottesmanbacteria bacterium GW2011_GWA2_47_9]|uniref:Transmembrane protein n=1 Tax=Candidatus Gottesmanbacteria bacterium GW2011_GWA2_47_9 TaxID=1618445 RepID=A0A0G1U1I3_9BACT|nr:MAG: hypothetical protein UY16_C0016G0016 [Candidatus Gottesmanbacteria bacterium GW2011_GWA2_47_9]
MKQVDVTKRVMDRVVAWERRQTAFWVGWFLVGAAVLAGALLAIVWAGTQEVLRRQTLDMLMLFTQDREIVEEFWQDTVMIVLTELPWEMIALGIFLCGIMGIYLLVTVSKRRLIHSKMSQLAQYEKTHIKKGAQP